MLNDGSFSVKNLWLWAMYKPKYFLRTGIALHWKIVERRESSVFCQKAKVSKPNANECSRRSEMSVFLTGNPIPVNPNA